VALHTTAWRTLSVRIAASIFSFLMLLVYRLFLASWSANLFFLMKLNEIKYDNVIQGERRGWMALLHASVEEEGDFHPHEGPVVLM
jgi:hypothetical protein